MPIKSEKQYGYMEARAHGTSNKGAIGGPSEAVAKEMIHKTPASTRSKFAQALSNKNKKKNNPFHGSFKDAEGMLRRKPQSEEEAHPNGMFEESRERQRSMESKRDKAIRSGNKLREEVEGYNIRDEMNARTGMHQRNKRNRY